MGSFFASSNTSWVIVKALVSHINVHVNGQNRIRLVYTLFKPRDQSPDKRSFDSSNVLRAMQTCAMSAERRVILKLPKSMVT